MCEPPKLDCNFFFGDAYRLQVYWTVSFSNELYTMDGERNLKAKIPEEPGENPEMSLVHENLTYRSFLFDQFRMLFFRKQLKNETKPLSRHINHIF